MAKKTFPTSAHIVKGARWYIDYKVFNPDTGEFSRKRKDFDLNDIADMALREAVAVRLCKYLGDLLPANPPKTAIPPGNTAAVCDTAGVPLLDAVARALAIKQRENDATSTRDDYARTAAKISAWVKKNAPGCMVADFSRAMARKYWDAESTRRTAKGTYLRGVTLNNHLTLLGALWGEMVARDWAKENIWRHIKPAKVEEKYRRPFTDEEKRIVAQEVEKTDIWMFRGILLQYFCYIRPVELTRLRFSDFNLGSGIVCVDVRKGGSRRKHYATIPASVMHYFTRVDFSGQPANYYVFGLVDRGKNQYTVEPSPVPCCENRPYKKHRKVLERLHKRGMLADISGLSWYSWKDTGISRNTHATAPISTRDQAGHKDFAITLKYYHAPQVNREYRELPNDLAG